MTAADRFRCGERTPTAVEDRTARLSLVVRVATGVRGGVLPSRGQGRRGACYVRNAPTSDMDANGGLCPVLAEVVEELD